MVEKEQTERQAEEHVVSWNSSEVIVQEIKIKLIVLNAPEISETIIENFRSGNIRGMVS